MMITRDKLAYQGIKLAAALARASGVTLDYDGNKVQGDFEFTARKRRGRIISPFKFDTEEELDRSRGRWSDNDIVIRKTHKTGKKGPKIILSTASGTVELKK